MNTRAPVGRSCEAYWPRPPAGRRGPGAPPRLGPGRMRVARRSPVDPPRMGRGPGRPARSPRPAADLLGPVLLRHVPAADRGASHARSSLSIVTRRASWPSRSPIRPSRRPVRAVRRARSDRPGHGRRAAALSPASRRLRPLRPRSPESTRYRESASPPVRERARRPSLDLHPSLRSIPINHPHHRRPVDHAPSTSRIHADRIAGRDRHHRHPDRPAPARRPGGPRGRPALAVHQQPEADRPGDPQLREHLPGLALRQGAELRRAACPRPRPTPGGRSTASSCMYLEQGNLFASINFNLPPETPGMAGDVAFMPPYQNPNRENMTACLGPGRHLPLPVRRRRRRSWPSGRAATTTWGTSRPGPATSARTSPRPSPRPSRTRGSSTTRAPSKLAEHHRRPEQHRLLQREDPGDRHQRPRRPVRLAGHVRHDHPDPHRDRRHLRRPARP